MIQDRSGALYAEEELVPLSALQHLLFCERQCALIHIEQIWRENPLTLEGRELHNRADADAGESRGDRRIARGVMLRSLRLGLSGKADVVEFHRVSEGGVSLAGAAGCWRPFPVEYKRGKPKPDPSDRVQLCAQALCLEEMLRTEVPTGALFYGRTRRRLEVSFSADLRAQTERTAVRLRSLLSSGKTPRAVRQPKCDRCSLFEACRPDAPADTARAYLNGILRAR